MPLSPGEFTDAQIARYERELAGALRRALKAIKAALKDAHTEGGRLVRDDFNLALTRRLGEEIARELSDAGGELAGEFRDTVRELIARVGELSADRLLGPEFTRYGTRSLEAQAGSRLDEIVRKAQAELKHAGDAVEKRLRQVALRELRETVTPARMVRDLSGAVGNTVGRTIALVDVTLAGADRAATVDFAEAAGVEQYGYSGPMDSLTRPDCARWVGHRFTLAQIDALESEIGPEPVLLFGGGYNCRHEWVPLLPADYGEWTPWRG